MSMPAFVSTAACPEIGFHRLITFSRNVIQFAFVRLDVLIDLKRGRFCACLRKDPRSRVGEIGHRFLGQ